MATDTKAKTMKPRAVTVTAQLFKRWTYRCILVPKAAFKVKPPIVPLPVVVTLAGDRFESTLSSQSPKDYYMVVPVGYLKPRGLEAGDSVTLRLEPDLGRTAPPLPRDAETYLRAQPALSAEYARMPVASRRQIVKYIEGVANEASRRARIETLGERLRERLDRRRRKSRN